MEVYVLFYLPIGYHPGHEAFWYPHAQDRRGSGSLSFKNLPAKSFGELFPSYLSYRFESMFSNGPEYETRRARPFVPPDVTLKQVHDAVPKHLLRPSERLSLSYVIRDVCFCIALFKIAASIEPWSQNGFCGILGTRWQIWLVKAGLWMVYWWFQGLVWAGMFCLGHDAGHGTLFKSKRVNNTIGFLLHTFLLIPYFAWRSTHHAHHKAVASIERDENYVPHLREYYNLPEEKKARAADYAEIFEETPIWTLVRVLIMQGFGWWLYLTTNAMGSRMYPPGTNHFQPSSPLFKDKERPYIMLSNVGLVFMTTMLTIFTRRFGFAAFLAYYFIPYISADLLEVMFTYLHHSDPTIPHYRKEEWSFLRGAAATVDRPLLGWMGRFFLHNISHDHVAHHFFVGAPFYNGPEITQAVRNVLGEHYNFDSTNTFYALWRSFTECLFVEDEGGIVFYKNRSGQAARQVHESALSAIREKGWDPAEQDGLSPEVDGASRQ
ncbi:hypothetical protein JAAARDRAFT_191632 [Jaapia argillacea MUCL 33604]|uniref:Fatty acid desaturase domain-containing protein n=1 Tax=Jaapia argillacea MUCL 33604 TaxID=933084 RepID=A0A067Q239_9AGAM|nr:hypothetical protein JAAARDRAFT_191632 [Jaapia argillacea MUCL 33604]